MMQVPAGLRSNWESAQEIWTQLNYDLSRVIASGSSIAQLPPPAGLPQEDLSHRKRALETGPTPSFKAPRHTETEHNSTSYNPSTVMEERGYDEELKPPPPTSFLLTPLPIEQPRGDVTPLLPPSPTPPNTPLTPPQFESRPSYTNSIDDVQAIELRLMRIEDGLRIFEGHFEIFRLKSNPQVECIRGYGNITFLSEGIAHKNSTLHGVQLLPGYKISSIIS